MASNLVPLPATEIPLVENPNKQILPIKFEKARWRARRSQNGRMDRADRHDRSAAGMLFKCCEDPALDSRIACVRPAPLFRGLSQYESCEIAHAAQELHYPHRETIFRQDDPVRYVYVVATGTVKVTQLSEGGKEVILRVDRGGSLIDDLTGALQVHASSAQAIHSCGALAWDVASFEDFAERFPVIHRNATSIMLGLSLIHI